MYTYNNGRICGDHFSDWCFTSTEKTTLIKFAMPNTQFPAVLAGPIPSLSPSLPDNETSLLRSDINISEQSSTNELITQKQTTPKTRKIQTLRSVVSKLRRKLQMQKENVNFLNRMKNSLTVTQYEFILSQIRSSARTSKGRRWTLQNKVLALNIFLQSPSAYRLLQKKLYFPSRSTLKRSIVNVAQKPGFCPVLLNCIKKQTSRMQDKDKLCLLCFDEICIKTAVDYCAKTDKIIGFEHMLNTENNKTPNLATKALVFLVRGLCQNWKQTVGYFFTSNYTSVKVLKKLVFQSLLILKEHGLNVVAVVCDQAPTNQALYRELNVTCDKPYFFVNDDKIFALYDIPHLLKSVRNNLKNYDIKFSDNRRAKWDHICKFFEFDQEKKYQQAPHLSKKHLIVNGLGKMSVKLAAQVLSHSVAAGICVYSSTGGLPADAVFTADFVKEMDMLFDSLNSKTLYSNKEYGGKESKHVKMWKEKINFIKSWHFFNTNTGKELKPPCQKGWILTLNSIIQIWEYISSTIDFLLTNKLNQDCLENTFSSIRKRGGYQDNPTPLQFQAAIRLQMVHTIFKRSVMSNCEDDDACILINLKNKISNKDILFKMVQEHDNFSQFNNEMKEFDISNCDIEIDIYEENVLAYISGFLGGRIFKHKKCEICKNLLLGQKELDNNKLLLLFKEYNITDYGLNWPTDNLLKTIKDLSNIFFSEIDNIIYKENISKTLCDKMNFIDFDWFEEHENHKHDIKKMLVFSFIKIMIKHKLKTINSTILPTSQNIKKN